MSKNSMTDWRKQNPEKARAAARRHYAAHKAYYKEYKWRGQGILPSQIPLIQAALLNPVCAICGSTKTKGKNWHADHDHSTGLFRGILCLDCNLLLGHATDSIELLERAIIYLKARR